jgi:hypothetical protein
VLSLWGVLTAEPARLNAPFDAMQRDQALWFLEHRDELELPLDEPLRVPTPRKPVEPKRDVIDGFWLEEQ